LPFHLKKVRLAVAFSDLVTIFFLRVGVVGSMLKPNLEDQASEFMSLETGWPSYTPGHWVSLFVASYNMQEYGGVILLRPHTEGDRIRRSKLD
jgi:hypothetical protein